MHFEDALNPVFEAIFQLRYANADRGVVRRMSCIAAETRIDTLKVFKLFARAGAGVGQAMIEPALEDLGVGVMALALSHHLAVPFKTVALKRLENRRLRAGHFTRRVEILHAQQPLTVCRARIEIGGEGCDQRAKMQVTTGSRRKAPDIGRFFHGRDVTGDGLGRASGTQWIEKVT